MKNIFFFDSMLTPKIVTGLYWLFLLTTIAGGISSIFYGGVLRGLIGMVVGCILVRIFFEMIIIVFKNNEYLRKIAEKS